MLSFLCIVYGYLRVFMAKLNSSSETMKTTQPKIVTILSQKKFPDPNFREI